MFLSKNYTTSHAGLQAGGRQPGRGRAVTGKKSRSTGRNGPMLLPRVYPGHGAAGRRSHDPMEVTASVEGTGVSTEASASAR